MACLEASVSLIALSLRMLSRRVNAESRIRLLRRIQLEVRKSFATLPPLICGSVERKAKCTLGPNTSRPFHDLIHIDISAHLDVLEILVFLVAVVLIGHYSVAALVIASGLRMLAWNDCLGNSRSSHVRLGSLK